MEDHTPYQQMAAALQQIATGPELSKSIPAEQARDAMGLILDGRVDPVQAGIFLIAMRVKRETDEENRGMFAALLERREPACVNTDTLVTLADPFNGFIRSIPATPFLLPLLAAGGLPACSHGMRTVGPKHGVTHGQILEAAGVNTHLDAARVGARIEDENVGWGYVDQAQYYPVLYSLRDLRDLMVKRTCITTFEVLLGPLRGRVRNHVLTGYVHKAYPPVYTALARQAGYDSATIVKGVEGGSIPSLSQPSRFHGYDPDGDYRRSPLKPRKLGIEQDQRCIPVPEEMNVRTPVKSNGTRSNGTRDVYSAIDTSRVARHGAELGRAALSGESGLMRDSLVYGAALCFTHCGKADSFEEGAEYARELLDSGQAMARFEAATGMSD